MSTALEVRKRIPKGSNLARKELELLRAMTSWGESFVQMGVVLESIYVDQDWRDGGFDNFDDYINKRQPCGIKKTHSGQLRRAAKVRHLLPSFNGDTAVRGVWTEWAVRPLTHKDFKPSDVKRLGKRIATLIKKGETLTQKLVKALCDDDRGVEKTKKKKKAKELSLTDTPAQVLANMTNEVDLWFMSLEKVPTTFWEDAVDDEVRSVKDLIASLSKLASFLRS